MLTLDGNNWERWSALMKLLFGAQDVFELVENGYEDLGANPTDVQRAAFMDLKKKDCRLCSTFSRMLIPITLRRFQRSQDPRKLGIS